MFEKAMYVEGANGRERHIGFISESVYKQQRDIHAAVQGGHAVPVRDEQIAAVHPIVAEIIE